jgi:hypothetical protein
MMTKVPFADPTQESGHPPPELQSQSLKPMLLDSGRTEEVTPAQDRIVDIPTPVKDFSECG